MARPLSVQDAEARRDAIRDYLAQYEDHATSAQLYAGSDKGLEHAAAAMHALTAGDAESRDPEPSFVRDCAHEACRAYRSVSRGAPAMESFVGIGRP